MKQTIVNNRIRGSGTVEILLAISLFMMLGTFIVGALVYSLSSTKLPNTKKAALEYASEGLEIVRYIRKGSLTNIADGTYGLLKSGSEWTLTSSPETITTGFTRSITISTQGTGQKLVTANVNWAEGGSSGVESVATILTNWQETIVTNPWQVPKFRNYYGLSATTYDVYGLNFLNGSLYALLRNPTKNTYLTTYNVANTASFVQQQQLTVIADNTVESKYTGTKLYLASPNNSAELIGVNTPSSTTNSLYANYNMSGNQDATGLDVVGNLIYITRAANATELSIIRDNNNATYTLLPGTYNSTTTLSDVAVRGSYAYASQTSANADLLIINVSNTSSLSLAATIDTPSATGTAKLAFWNQYLLMFTSDVGLVIYDCTTPTAPVWKATFATSGAINDYAFDQSRNLLFLATANSTSEFQVVDLTSMSAPVLRGSYNSAVPLTAIAFDSTNDRIYLGSSDDTNEFTILDAK